jgi:hypothetical protein
MEFWNNGEKSSTPVLQHSNTPVYILIPIYFGHQ